MKSKNILKAFIYICIIMLPINIFAAELDSPNYKIVGATTKGGGLTQTLDGDYSALLEVGRISNNPRNYSSSYKMFTSPEEAFLPAVPEISCFETTTSGSTNCTTGPSELTSGGMVAICGPSGCYDKARFEIDTNDNPTDTLYAVMISEDNFASDIRYIDGSSFWPETISTHNLSDFLTKSEWETEVFNIKGLQTNTLYYIRAFALHGDFTQTEPGPIVSVTTSAGSVFFDIDIAGPSGTTAESASPYSISFTGAYQLISGAPAVTAGDRIWLDASTNSEGGFAIVVRGLNGGLYSNTTGQTIVSSTADLDTASDGFGIQNAYISQDTYSYLGTISAMTDYTGTANSVGIVGTTATKVYESDSPVFNGRMGLNVIAKPGMNKTAASDYQESIYFVFIPRF
ncbi:MAG: hypothetical protein UR34_C0001G0040 [candidate division WS6 bacterium GW2011_GWC1_33_20]|uniref:Uncharacterized protein n=1 Tax=candidate division WS6 bacterium GW2011_GWC1_33_20 TaxID=1619089 RepID=A0A0F9ZKN3_9BACT|nr:MAG: hypothetical protein UR32_C0003G0085 [candidate division WS6 bacterium GW2011_GWE2_33_157]KKP44694.1 MAG: hypothetical protein UR34_C0001G0040 [candidate division WS6 bacterium GW2011_GWC1_33_20]